MQTTFPGFRRPGGRVAVRNLCLVLPTSEHLNRASELIESAVEDAVCVTHHNASPGSSAGFVLPVMTGFATNPNVGAVVLIGLGDEDDPGPRIEQQIAALGVPVELHTLRSARGLPALCDRVADRARAHLTNLGELERTACPVDALVLGTECGGSDAYSGLTANPALGVASDRLVQCGATVVLAEITELIGAEQLLAERATDEVVRADILRTVRAWEHLVIDFGEDMRGANPAPGNIAGGLTTIEEKSLGAAEKGGSTGVVEVVGFGRAPTRRGLVIMDTPGHDIEQLTGMAAGGCQIIAFTTGRGTPTASPVAPTIKISTNTRIAGHLAEHIDLDAGVIAEGLATHEQIGHAILDEILAVASGKQTKAERFGQRDFALPRTGSSV